MTKRVFKIQPDLFEGVTLTVETRRDGVQNLGHYPTVKDAMQASRNTESCETGEDYRVERRHDKRFPYQKIYDWVLYVREPGDGWLCHHSKHASKEAALKALAEWRMTHELGTEGNDNQTLNLF